MRTAIIVALFASTLTACVNGYERFYTPTPAAAQAHIVAANAQPQIRISSGNARADAIAMFTDGYGIVGSAAFNGPLQSLQGALAQAQKVGAAYVVVGRQYTNTIQGAVPITMPTSATSYTSGSVNVYGSGGSAFGNYSGTTTTYGTETTMMPYQIARYDQRAIFFAPLDRTGAGFMCRPTTEEEAQTLGSQRNCRVIAVRRGSPAYNADFLPGDFVVSQNGQAIDPQAPRANLVVGINHYVIVRQGKSIGKDLDVPAGW